MLGSIYLVIGSQVILWCTKDLTSEEILGNKVVTAVGAGFLVLGLWLAWSNTQRSKVWTVVGALFLVLLLSLELWGRLSGRPSEVPPALVGRQEE